MTVVMQQTAQKMLAHFHLQLKRQQYAVATKRIEFKADDGKRKWEKMWKMVSKNHTMTVGRSRTKISQIAGKRFFQKKNLTIFAILEVKPLDIVFEKTIDNIKEVNQNYVMV